MASKDEDIERLETKASVVLAAKRATRPRRPLLVEFCGSPKAGKTSAITSLQIFLKRNGFKVEVLTERASICPITDKRGWNFNVWTGCSALIGILEHIDSVEAAASDIVICDRGVFDALIWFDWLYNNGRLEPDIKHRLEGFFEISTFRSYIDLVLAFVARPEVSIKREYAHLLTKKEGSIMNEATLSTYLSSIDATITSKDNLFRAIKKIDTSELDQEEVGVQITESVLDAMSQALEERVGSMTIKEVESVVDGEAVFPLDALVDAGCDLEYDLRSKVERDVSRVQPIPVVVLTDRKRKQAVVFRKRGAALGGRSVEAGKTLLYAGGHVREEDAFVSSTEDLSSVLLSGLKREMKEELGSVLDLAEEAAFCVWERRVDGSRSQHMAVCYVVESNLDELRLDLDTYEFVRPGAKSQSGSVVDVKTLDGGALELWSRTILERVFQKELQGSLFD